MTDTWTSVAVTENRTPESMIRTWHAAGHLGLLRVEDTYRAIYLDGDIDGTPTGYALTQRIAWLNGWPVQTPAAARALADSAGAGGPPLLVVAR